MKNLASTKKIPVNTILRVYKKGFGYARLEVIENNDRYFAVLCRNELIENVSDGDILESYFWIEEDASYDFNVIVIGKITIGHKILFFNHTDDIKRTIGRKCIGLESDIFVKFFVFSRGDENKALSTEDVVFHNGKLLWLEDREAVIKSEDKIDENGFLKSNIKLGRHEIEVIGSIDLLNPDKNIYNITFTGMNDRDRNHILDYIFTFYRE